MKKEDRLIYEKLVKNETLKRQKQAFGKQFKHPIWYISQNIPDRATITKHILSGIKLTRFQKARYALIIINKLKKARRRKDIQSFEYPAKLYGFTLPLVQGNKMYGYVVLCNADKEIPDYFLCSLKLFFDTVIKEVQKELELTKLYETIRPRAIALSTIHTIHRLISSTLDIDELLPRIARLSIQVMRANRCSIKLLDKKRRVLIPKATVDLRKNKRIKLRNLPVGKGIPGRTAKLSKSLRGKSYLSVPLIDEDILGVITVYDKINRQSFTEFDQEILTTLAEQAVIAIKNAQYYKEQQDVLLGSIKSLAMIMNTRTPHVCHSSKIITRLTIEIGCEIGMKPNELKSLEVASLLHDAGQVSVPDEILAKRTRLTGKEFALVKEHPERGVKILEPLKALKPAVPMILHHHEKYDGSGYPKGLKGKGIPLGARIMAVTGAFEAMVILRPYRRRVKTIAEAVEEIKRYAGIQFDPKVVNAFIKVISRPDIKRLVKSQMRRRLSK